MSLSSKETIFSSASFCMAGLSLRAAGKRGAAPAAPRVPAPLFRGGAGEKNLGHSVGSGGVGGVDVDLALGDLRELLVGGLLLLQRLVQQVEGRVPAQLLGPGAEGAVGG